MLYVFNPTYTISAYPDFFSSEMGLLIGGLLKSMECDEAPAGRVSIDFGGGFVFEPWTQPSPPSCRPLDGHKAFEGLWYVIYSRHSEQQSSRVGLLLEAYRRP